MQQVMKTIFLASVMVFGLLRSASAFTPAGPVGAPGDVWQVASIGYGPPYDVVAPKNVGEEYRRNTPVMYWACDASFLSYFGPNGMAQVASAFDVMNNVFTNNPTGMTNGLDGYSSNLSEFQYTTRHINYQAQALGIYDLKTATLNYLVRQMGLADPVEYSWTLHDRSGPAPGATCPAGMEYTVIQRNFDTGGAAVAGSQSVLSLYSPYVNDVLYNYYIEEDCPVLQQAVTVPFAVDPDPNNNSYSAIASQFYRFGWGEYVTGLSRDDVMGLRYLLSDKTINLESPVTGSLLTTGTTNLASEIPFPPNTTSNNINGYGTLNLGTLLSASVTNDPVTLETLFPGVIVGSTITNLAYVTNFTIVAYFTNYIGSAAGSPPTLVIATNATLSFEIVYYDTFANVITNHYYSNSVVTLQTVTVGPLVGAAAPAPIVTNVTTTSINLPGVPSGDYYILPTNNACGIDIAGVFFTNVILQTNLTSAIFGTNASVATNGLAFSYTQDVTPFTNYVFAIHPVACNESTNSPGIYEGIQKINFVESYFDDFVGTFYQPITNTYTENLVNTNGLVLVQSFQRVVTTPDILLSAADDANGPAVGIPPGPGSVLESSTTPNFDTADVPVSGLAGATPAGPGTINPPLILSFDKVGPVYFNNTVFGSFLTGTNYGVLMPSNDNLDFFYGAYFVWGSFDGTTNAPVVYPDGQSIDSLGNLILIQISPTSLRNGNNGVPYSPAITFTTSGGAFTPPFTWTASGLPSGLTLSAGGTLSGTPTQSGSFDFTLTMTDSAFRTVQWNYPIIIQ